MKQYFSQIKIIIADDHEVFRDGLASLLATVEEFDCIAEAANGNDLLLLIDRYQPDVVILDIKMPGLDGVSATRTIREKFPAVRILVLSMFDDELTVNEIMSAGANGYMLKDTHKSQIIEAVRKVYKGDAYYCPKTIQIMSASLKRKFNNLPEPHEVFTQKEKEIISMICKEYSSKEIADQLQVSKRTIESHRQRIMEKMNVKSVVGLTQFAIKYKMTETR